MFRWSKHRGCLLLRSDHFHPHPRINQTRHRRRSPPHTTLRTVPHSSSPPCRLRSNLRGCLLLRSDHFHPHPRNSQTRQNCLRSTPYTTLSRLVPHSSSPPCRLRSNLRGCLLLRSDHFHPHPRNSQTRQNCLRSTPYTTLSRLVPHSSSPPC